MAADHANLSKEDQRMPERPQPEDWSLIRPVTAETVRQALKTTSKSSAGPDNVSPKDLRRMSHKALASHYNLWLLAAYVPKVLGSGKTIFIPKEQNTRDPLKHRPITVSSFIIRLLHRILGNRMATEIKWNQHQKRFIKGDAEAQNLLLLRTLVNSQKEELKPLNLVFIDVKKAFDSVSHQSVIKVAYRLRVPDPLSPTFMNTIMTVSFVKSMRACIKFMQLPPNYFIIYC